MRKTDYLIVGAGASGLAFADEMLDQSEAELLLLDRRTRVGGHWCDAYPFVRLHTPSAYYGVNSTKLGADQIIDAGHNKGFYEQATGAEVCAYFDAVLTQRLVPSARAGFLGGHEFLGFTGRVARIRDLATGERSEVAVRRRLVDARYQEASIPATHTPSFSVDANAAFVPVGLLPERAGEQRGFTIIGAGKTAVDACLWLLDQGTDPDRICWIRPRDMWFNDRAGFQPLDHVGSIMDGLADDAEAGAKAVDIVDLCHRLEEMGRLMRLDQKVEPTMYRGTMLSRSEWTALRQIANVIRLGRVNSIRSTRLELSDGELPTGASTLHVDCSARGLAPTAPVAIFDGATIRLQQIRHNSPTFNAALIAFLEGRRNDDSEKNRLAPPNPFASTPHDMAGMLSRTWKTERRWQAEPDLQSWVDASRLNLLRGLPRRMGDPVAKAAVVRFLTNVAPAIVRLPTLT
jgi:NAD(P)-binding Rossmann-like domain